MGENIIKVENQSKIDVSNFAKGIYILKLTDGENIFTTKFIKQ